MKFIFGIMTFANGDINKEGIFSNGKYLYSEKLRSIERCEWDKRFQWLRMYYIKEQYSIIKTVILRDNSSKGIKDDKLSVSSINSRLTSTRDKPRRFNPEVYK